MLNYMQGHIFLPTGLHDLAENPLGLWPAEKSAALGFSGKKGSRSAELAK